MRYRVESTDLTEPNEIAIDYLGDSLSEARAVARRLSNFAHKHDNYDGVYVVAEDGSEKVRNPVEDVGQIVYYYGVTSSIEGRIK